MPRPADNEGDGLVRLGHWGGGINNVKPETGLSAEELRDSVNYEYDRAGVPSARVGRTLRKSGTSCHSLWSNGVQTVYFDSGSLLLLDTDTWETDVLATGYTAKRFSYAQIGSRLYFSNGESSGRLDLNTEDVLPGLGTPTPGLNVTLTAQTTGGLSAGTYLVGITFEDTNYEESGCPGVASVAVVEGGGISVSLVGPRPPGATYIRVYRSPVNGTRKELRTYARIPVADTQVTVTNRDTGRLLRTLYLETMPHCRYLTAYNGHLYGAVGNEVIHSAARRYGLHDPDGGSLGVYPTAVTMVSHSPGAVFVVADRTYAYVGTIPGKQALRDDVFNHPAIPGSGTLMEGALFTGYELPKTDLPYWFTSRGAVLGLPDGSVLPLMKGKAEPDRFSIGASGLVEINGMPQMVTSLQGRQGDGFAMADSFSARVVCNGVDVPVDPGP